MLAAAIGLAAVSLLVWLGLVLAHGGFWRADQRLGPAPTGAPGPLPRVVAVVPARDEAAVIARSIGSLLRQRYDGAFKVVLVDDHSSDGTAEIARAAAAEAGAGDRLVVTRAAPLPDGWAGKMWAVAQGVIKAEELEPEADYVLFTDADIEHGDDALARLVAKAEAGRLDMVSLMVLLNCRSAAEKLLIPAFVYFFQKLYPFRRVNDPRRRLAAAAGGCMLVRRAALERAGGIPAIKSAIIDDCALARAIKAGGPIWLGLTRRSASIRPYPAVADVWNMVARTAYTQLRYSPLLLLGTVLGMVLVYIVPPAAVVAGAAVRSPWLVGLGGAAWLLMMASFLPTLRLYRMGPWHAPALPVAALLYTLMTVDSAWRHWRGRGGGWKGRTYAGASS